MNLPKSLQNAINELGKLPGVGPKSAQRLGLFLLKKNPVDLEQLANSLRDIKSTVSFCRWCHTMSDTDPCSTCNNSQRDRTVLCVVEEPLDALALEKSGSFNGLYHVLGGVLNPLEGIGPDQLHIQSLLTRVHEQGLVLKEVILATNPTLEGETTARLVSKVVKENFPEVIITRIARGLPTGGDLEYADDLTLSRALTGRGEF